MTIQQSNKILVIDDEKSVRENIAAYLEDSDFAVLQAENGRKGVEVYEQEKPDVILVDIDMPEMNGLEVIVEIRKVSDETPIIIVSGAGDVKYTIEASRLGAWDFVMKPIYNMSVVEHTIYKVLEHRDLLRENREYKENLEKKVQERTVSLEMRTSELQQTNQKLIDEIEERKWVEAQLRQSKERSVALRRFSNRISEFKDEAKLLETALEELCANIYLSGAILFYNFKSNRFTQRLPGTPTLSFLDNPPSFEYLRSVFSKRSQEIAVFNDVSPTSQICDFYTGQRESLEEFAGGHFVFFRGHSLHQHLFCFFRDPLYAEFNNLDIEYLKSMIVEINTAYYNIQIMRVNSWLEQTLKSVIPESRSAALAEIQPVAGFETATSVYPAYKIKAESHKMISISDQESALLMSDTPGKGMSDIMYNGMVGELLSEHPTVLADPEKVMALLNEELQTDFHPNRYLTLNYFLFQENESIVSYSNLGHESMTLMKFDKNSHITLIPRQSPFVQIHLDRGGGFFHKEFIRLDPGEMVFGFTHRMGQMINEEGKQIDLEILFEFVRQSIELTPVEVMEKIMRFFIDTFPKELQKDDVNLILIKRV